MGYDLQIEEDFHFVSRKPKKSLEKTLGNLVWMVSGKQGTEKKKKYFLAGLFVPDEILDDEEDVKTKHIFGYEGAYFEKPIEVSGEKWFHNLKKQQANFSLGISEIQDKGIIDILLSKYNQNFQHITSSYKIPEEGEVDHRITEGKKISVQVNRYERSAKGRAECIKFHGLDCAVCGLNFKKVYGEIGRNFIHVHHTNPLASKNTEYLLDPKKDLRPVCPNCHAMLHRKEGNVFTVEELKEKLNKHGQI